jgi:hypothetical protein
MDESKHAGFVLAASICPMKDVVRVRREMESLLMPGQVRLHFRKEKISRKHQILEVIANLPLKHVVLDATSIRHENRARMNSFRAFLQIRDSYRAEELRIEIDASHFTFDKRVLSQFKDENFHFSHHMAKHEPGLWIPDAVAWCYARNGKWRSLINYEQILVR